MVNVMLKGDFENYRIVTFVDNTLHLLCRVRILSFSLFQFCIFVKLIQIQNL